MFRALLLAILLVACQSSGSTNAVPTLRPLPALAESDTIGIARNELSTRSYENFGLKRFGLNRSSCLARYDIGGG